MPNIKSSAKRDALSKAKHARNKAEKSALRTAVKKFRCTHTFSAQAHTNHKILL